MVAFVPALVFLGGAGLFAFTQKVRKDEKAINVAQSAINAGLVDDPATDIPAIYGPPSTLFYNKPGGHNFIGDGYGGINYLKIGLLLGTAYVGLKVLQEGRKVF